MRFDADEDVERLIAAKIAPVLQALRDFSLDYSDAISCTLGGAAYFRKDYPALARAFVLLKEWEE